MGYYLQKARAEAASHDFKTLKIVSSFSNHLLATILSIDLDAWGLEYHVSQDSFEDVAAQLDRLKVNNSNHESVILAIRDADLYSNNNTDTQSMKMKIEALNSLISHLTHVKFHIIPIIAVHPATSQEIALSPLSPSCMKH